MTSDLNRNAAGLLLTCLLSLILTQLVMALANRFRWIVKPKEDRWHKTPTALFGGIAIVSTFTISGLWVLGHGTSSGQFAIDGLVMGGLFLFVLGLRDDAKPLNPIVKLLGQIFAVMPFVMGLGLSHANQWFVLGIPVVLFWMVGLTNAMNLLDNMNGLSAGTATIIGGFLSYYCYEHGEIEAAQLSALVSASCAGFLYYNARFASPARIFMGDCGSMFLGYMLAGLIVIGVWDPGTAPVATLTIPLLLMALPIFDTSLVIIRRRAEGRAISQGGRDHSSHRLVYAGCTEKQAVLSLYAVCFAGGLMAVSAEHLRRPLMLIAAAAISIGALWMLGALLSRFPGPQFAAVSTIRHESPVDTPTS